MSINIQAKSDYTYLFSSLGSSSSSSSTANLSFLSDYALIKSGSYTKLMKAYYSESGSSSAVSSLVGTNSTSADDAKTLTRVESATDSLKDSADTLLAKGSKSVWADEDMEEIYTAVSDFVKDCNSVLDTMDDVNSTSILSRAKNMTQYTAVNENLLAKVGITIGSDNSLSIDKETFLEADISTVKSIFNGNGSFAYRTSAYASLINYAAEQESGKSATYTVNGTYSSTYSSGSLFDSLY